MGMPSRYGFRLLLCMGLAVLFLGTTCAAAGVLRIRFDSTIRSLDPAYTTHTRDYAVDANIYSTLVKYVPESNKTELVGDLAESWTVREDGLEYTFFLRHGVQWHRGYGEVTAADVKFSIERVMDKATASPSAWAYDAIRTVEAPDPYVLKVTLSRPDPKLIHMFAPFRQGFIVCERAVEEYGKDYGIVAAIGSGPFMFKEWIPNDRIVIEANRDYYGDKAKLDQVIFIIIPDETTAKLALLSGEIDLMQFSAQETLGELRAAQGLSIVQQASMKTYALAMNTRISPLDDIRVRQAIAYSIDQFELVDALLPELAIASINFIPPGSAGYTTDIMTYPRDVEAAKALLRDAGYPGGLELTAMVTKTYVDMLTVIQGQLEEAGIRLQIKVVDVPTWTERVMTKGEYQISTYSLGGRPVETSVFLRQVLHSGAFPPGLDYVWYSGADELIDEADATTDVSARHLLYEEIQKKVAIDIPAYPVYYPTINIAYRQCVHGFILDIFHGEGDGLEYVYIAEG